MLTEKECVVIRSLLQDEINMSQEYTSAKGDEIVNVYISTLKGIESKLCAAEMVFTV